MAGSEGTKLKSFFTDWSYLFLLATSAHKNQYGNTWQMPAKQFVIGIIQVDAPAYVLLGIVIVPWWSKEAFSPRACCKSSILQCSFSCYTNGLLRFGLGFVYQIPSVPCVFAGSFLAICRLNVVICVVWFLFLDD